MLMGMMAAMIGAFGLTGNRSDMVNTQSPNMRQATTRSKRGGGPMLRHTNGASAKHKSDMNRVGRMKRRDHRRAKAGKV